MKPFLRALSVALLAACTSEVGGGGVNIDVTAPSVTITTAAAATTPTTTSPTTTSTTVSPIVVTGTVARPDGRPVSRAVVTMGDSRQLTGPDGTFRFETSDPETISVAKRGWTTAEVPWDATAGSHDATIDLETMRGLRVSGEAAGDDHRFGLLLTLAETTAVNAFVFDTKHEGGQVLYDTTVSSAHDIGAVEPLYEPVRRLEETHAAGLYAITRIVTFEDESRVRAFPEEKLAGVWLDPAAETARDYNLDLAVEACELGFDEVQFDYVRYPSGRTATVSGQLQLTQEERLATISRFLAEARDRLHPLGCAVSAAIFGIVVSAENDQGIGQRPEEVSAEVDVVSPMVYPSHYSGGWLGFEDPNDHPYEVTADAIADVLPRLSPGAGLRPWLQAFWWTDEEIRRSIQAAEDNGVGWILWNVRSNYDAAALPTEEEVSVAP